MQMIVHSPTQQPNNTQKNKKSKGKANEDNGGEKWIDE